MWAWRWSVCKKSGRERLGDEHILLDLSTRETDVSRNHIGQPGHVRGLKAIGDDSMERSSLEH
eukprot:709036-Karenia_brevis.AAC.1